MKHRPGSSRNQRPDSRARSERRAPSESAPSLSESRETTSQLVRQRELLGPRASEPIPSVMVKTRSLYPLLYRKRLERVDNAKPGDLVAVYNGNEPQPFAYGLYNSRSELALRLLWGSADLPTDESWRQKLLSAVSLRRDVLKVESQTNAWRIIHAEADGLSGFVVDYFNGIVSGEAFSLGMYQRGALLLPMIAEILGAEHWMLKTSPQFLSQEGCDPPPLSSPNCPSNVIVQEYGTRFRIRFEGGHKTGFFCDQRENRRRLADFCAGKSVLDLCCYTGGFSVQAKTLGQAEDVIGVDLDEDPLKIAKENANLNQARVRFVQADIFSYMREMIRNQKQFDVVILDPPKLIRSRLEIEEGTRKHYAMNRLAMKLVRPGGLLLSCSCAGLLPEPEFVQLLASAARSVADDADQSPLEVPRSLQIIAKSGAAPDHPVSSNCLETEYLKAVWMIVN
ncbi:MAG: class I SAM-dependent rRNA methyltransferase [Planctomycetaceae bacterium]|nr:class I SAM-dependent rRNA methyltransferase [Planctomycetaceae bacterium]